MGFRRNYIYLMKHSVFFLCCLLTLLDDRGLQCGHNLDICTNSDVPRGNEIIITCGVNYVGNIQLIRYLRVTRA